MYETKDTARSLKMIRLFVFFLIVSVSFCLVPQVILAAPINIDIDEGDVTISSGTTTGYINVEQPAPGNISHTNVDPSTYPIVITGTATTANKIIVGNNVTACDITLDDVDIDLKTLTGMASPFSIGTNSTVNLTLINASTLKGDNTFAGLSLDPTGELIIDGAGSLTVDGGTSAAGIGGNDGTTPGEIIINNGTITATGGSAAAGIGGGDGGSGGMITFNDGTVIANGGANAAGIGGGQNGDGGTIEFNGGIIEANGDDFAAGIGGGDSFDGSTGTGGNGGNLIFKGSAVTATGGKFAAGIGGGNGGDGGMIEITDGDIKANGGEAGAGIGGGVDEGANITLTGGTIDAVAGYGAAGIGGGFEGDNIVIEISGSAFITNAQGGDAHDDPMTPYKGGGAGIGTGGTNTGTPLTIAPGSIIISAGVDLARVFGGSDDSTYTAGAQIGSGGADVVASVPHDTHTITYYDNVDPEEIQSLTYTVDNTGKSDAVLPDLTFVQLYNAAFAPTAFDNYWYETRTGNAPHGVGLAFPSTTILELYAFGEPKTGL